FPPSPPSTELVHRIITDYCSSIKSEDIEEAGCAVCGVLTAKKNLHDMTKQSIDLKLLSSDSPFISRLPRSRVTDEVHTCKGPLLASKCSGICNSCLTALNKGKIPSLALVNGNWLGDIPPQLQGLSWIEKMLISRVSHNRCIVRVHSSGQWKMKANAVFFSTPTPKILAALPPKLEDLDEVLAIIFIGTIKPTESEFRRTPLLVRRNKVAEALEWLKLNHIDYSDLQISYQNLQQYPETLPPVVVECKLKQNPVEPGSLSVDNKEEGGVENGECPFIVHGLLGSDVD
ncbi:hypothetical protein DENSPDRAFT_757329, partial [Dentipellis sp. KUC8613]